nr:hypothetical protein [Nanoarchaeum sp.]
MKTTLKNKVISGIVGLTGMLVASTPGFAQSTGNANIRVQDELVTTRVGAQSGPISFNGYNIDRANGTDETGGHIVYTDNIVSGNVPTGFWLRGVDSGENHKTQTGLDFTLSDSEGNSHYIAPAWLTFDQDGFDSYGVFALGNQKVSSELTLDYGLAHFSNPNGENTHAEYASIKNADAGVSVGRDYDGRLRPAVGFRAGNIGDIVYSIHNLENGDYYVRNMIAQNPGSVAGPDGTKTIGEVLTIDAYLPETYPYFSGIAGKSTSGFALETIVSNQNGQRDDLVEVGYNLGNGVGVSAGKKWDSKGEHYLGKILYQTKKFLGELRLREHANPEVYAQVKGISF